MLKIKHFKHRCAHVYLWSIHWVKLCMYAWLLPVIRWTHWILPAIELQHRLFIVLSTYTSWRMKNLYLMNATQRIIWWAMYFEIHLRVQTCKHKILQSGIEGVRLPQTYDLIQTGLDWIVLISHILKLSPEVCTLKPNFNHQRSNRSQIISSSKSMYTRILFST